jgi:hypothetical protein
MCNFAFWQRWLFYSSLLFMFLGIYNAFAPDGALYKWYNDWLFLCLYNNAPTPEVIKLRDFLSGPLGATMAATYLLTAWISNNAFKQRETRARNAIVCSFLLWFIIDSYIAFKMGVLFHIYTVNLFSLLIKALPIFFTWKEFEGKAGENKE